jgi:hypothetical protein
MDSRWIACALAVLVVVIILVIVRMYDSEQALTGFWKADSKFLERSGLQAMSLYIDAGFCARRGYLLLQKADGALIYSGEVGIKCSPMSFPTRLWSSILRLVGFSEYSLSGTLTTFDEFGKPQIPPEVDILFNTQDNTLAFSAEKQLYGFFFKDNEASDAARSA